MEAGRSSHQTKAAAAPESRARVATDAYRPNEAWCLDFAYERVENGRQARILGVLDCFTRENLLLRARPNFPAFQVQEGLEWLFLIHGKPQRIISDNGPEFRALQLSVEHEFIQPGKPWQNGYIESFIGKLRDELLSCDRFNQAPNSNLRSTISRSTTTTSNLVLVWEDPPPRDSRRSALSRT